MPPNPFGRLAQPVERFAGALGEVSGRVAGRAAVEVVRQVSASRIVRDAAAGAVASVIGATTSADGEAPPKPDMKLERAKAIDLARQMRGQYSERTVIDGEYHYVVWKDGQPVRAFPDVRGRLSSKPELADFNEDLLRSPRGV